MPAHRVLTTHTGSLGRAPELRDMLLAKSKREHVDEAEFDAAVHRAVADVVKRQCEVGLDIINDGEQSKTGFAQYVHERLQGFEGEPVRRVTSLEAREFPDAPTGSVWQQACTGPLAWKNFAAVERDIKNMRDAAARSRQAGIYGIGVAWIVHQQQSQSPLC